MKNKDYQDTYNRLCLAFRAAKAKDALDAARANLDAWSKIMQATPYEPDAE
jgi:hypothetical protein